MFERVDKTLLTITVVLLIGGLVIFSSAALGVLSVNEAKFYSVIKTQLIYALIGGSIMLYVGSLIPYNFYRKYAYILFFGALVLTTLVFIPALSQYHGGAHRWIDIGFISFQPSELLKFSFVVAVAFWCSRYRNNFRDWKFGLLPFLGALGVVSIILLMQPDFGTWTVTIMSAFAAYFVGGARMKHIYILVLCGFVGIAVLIAVRPYMLERIKTFVNNTHDPRGSSWQLNQSLIALGSGGLTGRGLGQSVQKFNYLPEPIGDSVFAVLGEEIGFFGVIILIVLYGILGWRGYIISMTSSDQFGRLLAIGITVIILVQASLNISSMLGIMPLTGVPLPLVSHGGTALMVILFEIGVLLNISKNSQNLV
ncbi:MAG: Cell division protein FtsW [Candidatus Nomurabacteria bacterium]|nr:Cell division protein FtsW [Candidatus Nomurabacteria bacterium]